MSSNDSAAAQQASELTEKSKGKQVEQHDGGDMSMDDDSEGEDSGVEEVSNQHPSELSRSSLKLY